MLGSSHMCGVHQSFGDVSGNLLALGYSESRIFAVTQKRLMNRVTF